MIPNPPTKEEIAFLRLQREMDILYKQLDYKDLAIKILCAALPVCGALGVLLGWILSW